MERSPYLTQALQAMQQPPAAAPAPSVDIQALARMAGQRQAWEKANPGQSYGRAQMAQIGQGIRNLPKTIGAVPGNVMGAVTSLPGEAMGGLMSLGRSILGK